MLASVVKVMVGLHRSYWAVSSLNIVTLSAQYSGKWSNVVITQSRVRGRPQSAQYCAVLNKGKDVDKDESSQDDSAQEGGATMIFIFDVISSPEWSGCKHIA